MDHTSFFRDSVESNKEKKQKKGCQNGFLKIKQKIPVNLTDLARYLLYIKQARSTFIT